MSLVSIYKNKELIRHFYEINKYSIIDNKTNLRIKTNSQEYVTKVISDCLLYQYDMMRKYLNINAINKRFFDSNLKGDELLDAWYQHIFSHNYIALNDEYYEVYDALYKFAKNSKLLENECNNEAITIAKEEALIKIKDKIFMSDLLITEEVIDAFHFILEYVIITEELYQLMLEVNREDITVNNLEYFFVDCSDDNKFYNAVKTMLDKEASHIASYILNNDYREMFEQSCVDINNKDMLVLFNTKINRAFVRETNFKDWKKYDFRQFYSQLKFANLFILTRNMFMGLIYMIHMLTNNFDSVRKMLNTELNYDCDTDYEDIYVSEDEDEEYNYFMNYIFSFLYAIYMSKREENIRRQGGGDKSKADPRYYSNGTGSVVGDKV